MDPAPDPDSMVSLDPDPEVNKFFFEVLDVLF